MSVQSGGQATDRLTLPSPTALLFSVQSDKIVLIQVCINTVKLGMSQVK